MKKYIFWGTGEIGKGALEYFGKDKVTCFCSNESERTRQIKAQMFGVSVISPKELIEKDYHDLIVITVSDSNFEFQISRQLDELGIPYITVRELMTDICMEELMEYEKLNKRKSFAYNENYFKLYPFDRLYPAGGMGSYFWQDLWAAKHIYHNRPQCGVHYDVASRIDGFVAHLLAMDLTVRNIDIRPLESTVPGMEFVQSDATCLDGIEDESIESFSALCSLEHFGLGRYGDPIDPDACFKCFEAIQNKCMSGAYVYISVPVAKERLQFNGCRVFYPQTIINSFHDMELIEFCTCDEDVVVESDIHRYDNDEESERVGLFMFRKR